MQRNSSNFINIILARESYDSSDKDNVVALKLWSFGIITVIGELSNNNNCQWSKTVVSYECSKEYPAYSRNICATKQYKFL